MSQRALVEQLLFAELSSQLAQQGIVELSGSAWSASLAVLNAEGMSAAEEDVLDAEVESEAIDPIARLLGLRIERAMRAGLEASGAAETVLLPEVMILRTPEKSGRDEEGRILAAALARLRSGLSAGLKGSNSRLIVVAARQLYEKLKQVMPVGRVGGKPIIEYCDDGPPDHATTATIEIVSGEVRLASLENRATLHLSATFGESLGSDSLRAAWLAASDTSSLSIPPVPARTLSPEEFGDRETLPIFDAQLPEALVGALFHNKYRILRVIGKGGFGAVYEAEDERGAGNRVAIKVLSGKAAESAAQQQSFKDEARRVTRLSHPNIVDWKVFDETEDGTPYFVMELVEGEEFEATLRRERRLVPERAAKLLLQVLDALRAAHHLSNTESILHLDLKPANLFHVPPRANRPEQLKVIDFGIGQYIGDGEVRDETVVPTEGVVEGDLHGPGTLTFKPPTELTRDSGRIARSKGCTPEYASPEQCAHVMYMQDIVALDGRSDLYSLGVIAFEMLTGQLPFKSRTRLDVMRMHREDPAPKVGSMGVKIPRKLAKFVDRCLQKDRDARWKNTQEAYQFLHEVVHPPVWKAVAKVAVPVCLVAIALGTWGWMSREVPVPTAGLFTTEGVALDTEPLYLGAGRPSARLELRAPDGILPEDRGGEWTLRRVSDGSTPENWKAAWTADGFVELEAPTELSGRVQEQVELVLDEDVVRSRPLRIVWIGPGSWEVDAVQIGGRPIDQLSSMSIDPFSMSLDLWVTGDSRADLAQVSVQFDQDEPHRLSGGSSSSDRVRYRLDLADARLEDGPRSLRVLVRDFAGGEWTQTLEQRVVHGIPELQRFALVDRSSARDADGEWPETNKILGSYSITPRTQPALRVRLVRPADVTWRVYVQDTAEPALAGRSDGRREFEAPLDDLLDLQDGRPFRGRIELIADESAYVLHAPGSERSVLSEQLSFSFEDSVPSFAASWRSRDASRALPADSETPVFTNAAEANVVLTREQPVPMRVELAWWPSGRPGDLARLESGDLINPQVQQVALPIALDADGEWIVRLRSYRYDAQAQSVGERPDVERQVRVVLDRRAPSAEFVGFEAGTVLGTDPLPTDWSVRVVGDANSTRDAGVSLTWQVRDLGADELVSLAGTLPELGGEGLSSSVTLDEFGAGAAELADGRYRLELSGSDRAGNALAPSGVEFEVSRRGPEVELLQPSSVGKWRRDPTFGRWALRARVRDANGVDGVTCMLVAGAAELPMDLEFEEGSSRDEQSLIADFELPYDLSEQRIRLSFAAVDAYGSVSSWTSEEFELPVIAPPAPERIAVAFGDRPIESMRLVRGNSNFQYLFGGRGDELENPDFVRAGLGAFSDSPRRSRSRSWQVPFAAGSIEDYYLDEREVSVSQFLAFLRDPRGYRGTGHWPDGERPEDGRRATLTAELEQRDGDLPVTGVTWAEARAYAAWAGKRLPSWVEWEFAVRGGAAYRPYAAFGARVVEASAGSDPPLQADLGPRGVRDWTPDRHFADLCSNVAEWTGTGMSTTDSLRRYPHQWALEDPTRLQRIDDSADNYWIVGGRYGNQRGDFTAVDHRPAAYRHETIGFRCALSLREFQDRLGLQRSDRPSFEEHQ